MNKLTVLPQNIEIQVDQDKDLLTALKENNIFVKTSCGGCASCTHCIIAVTEGESYVNEMSFEEKQVLGNTFHMTKERLSCQTKISGDVTIDVSMHQEPLKAKTKPRVRKKEEVIAIKQERFEKRAEKPKKLGGGKKPKPFNYSTQGEE